MKTRSRLPGLVSLGAALLLPLAGCGDGQDRRYPVSGHVTFQGTQVPKGTVNFLPADPTTGRPAFGEIQGDGSYKLTTLTPHDGAVAGKYRVIISAVDVDLSKVELVGAGVPRHEQLIKAPRKYLVPPSYGDPSISTLTAEVTPSKNERNFDLK